LPVGAADASGHYNHRVDCRIEIKTLLIAPRCPANSRQGRTTPRLPRHRAKEFIRFPEQTLHRGEHGIRLNVNEEKSGVRQPSGGALIYSTKVNYIFDADDHQIQSARTQGI
jgi:hypothetical protein